MLPDDITETDKQYKSAKDAGLDLSHITDKDREQFSQMQGTIVSIGGSCFQGWGDPIPKVGDRIKFDKYAGSTIPINEVKHRLISDTDVLAIVEYEDEQESTK